MRERLLAGASALARLVLVVVGFGLAVGSIGLSATRGFCPAPESGPLALSAASVLADATDDATDEAPAEEDTCPGGLERCLPPLWSSILLTGEPACHDQAPAELRGTLVPAFVGATIAFAAAWWLRPTRLHPERHPVEE